MADCFKDAVCVDCGKVYDSCCDRDCLEDLRVYFSSDNQQTVNNSAGARVRSCEILNVAIEVEPITFNRGYYSVDMVFYFLVNCDIYTALSATPVNINGVAVWNKKVILYGSDENAKTFSSIYNPDGGTTIPATANYPRATVQTVEPIVLNSSLVPVCGCDNECTCTFPKSVIDVIGSVADQSTVQNKVVVTIGLFSVVQLIRNVQMLIPVYDFCVPEKECTSTTDNPCELFKKIKFPLDEFFPPQNLPDDQCGCSACDGKQ